MDKPRRRTTAPGTAGRRRLVAILAADVVGYAGLMEQDEDRTLARLAALRQNCVAPLITRYRGRTVKLMGDGALVEFTSVVDAVRCAVAVQQVCGGKEARLPSSGRIQLRIGINLGDGVNVAPRLEHLAEPGGVILSGTAYDHLQGKLDLPLEFIGERRVRSIERPVRIYRVRFGGTAARLRFRLHRSGRSAAALLLMLGLGAGAWWHGLHGPGRDAALPDRPAIAVLPFDDLSGSGRQERLAGAFTEDLLTELARTRSLPVITCNSVRCRQQHPSLAGALRPAGGRPVPGPRRGPDPGGRDADRL
jgi:class 3 adenylate cyclase